MTVCVQLELPEIIVNIVSFRILKLIVSYHDCCLIAIDCGCLENQRMVRWNWLELRTTLKQSTHATLAIVWLGIEWERAAKVVFGLVHYPCVLVRARIISESCSPYLVLFPSSSGWLWKSCSPWCWECSVPFDTVWCGGSIFLWVWLYPEWKQWEKVHARCRVVWRDTKMHKWA